MKDAPVSPYDALWAELHNLRILPLVHEAGSFAEAARRLNCSPSAVVRGIESLEAALKTALVERQQAGVIPTDVGVLVAKRAIHIADELHAAAKTFIRKEPSSPSMHTLEHLLFSGNRLRLIRDLAETGSTTAAARALGISQPSVSMGLGRIEDILGEPMFRRTKRGLEPMERADILLGYVHRVAAQLRQMLDEIASRPDDIAGTVGLGLLAVARLHLVPAAVVSTRRGHPRVRVRTMVSSFDRMLEALTRGQIDAVIGVAETVPDKAGFRVETIAEDYLAIFVRTGHPCVDRNGGLAALLGEGWIMPRRESLSWQLIERVFSMENLPVPLPVIETTDIEFTRQMILSSDLLAVASPHQFAVELRAGTVVRLSVSMPGCRRGIAIIERERAMPSPAVRLLLDAIRVQAKQGSF